MVCTMLSIAYKARKYKPPQKYTKLTNEYINYLYKNRSRTVRMYPHLIFDTLYSYDELMSIVIDIKLQLFPENMEIFEKNNYCYELNGEWNVCFGIKDSDGNVYTYMIMRDLKLNKSYACPFVNLEYGSYLNHTIFNDETHPDQFIKLEQFLITNYYGIVIHNF